MGGHERESCSQVFYCPSTAKRRIKEAMIKSAASAASLGFAGEHPDDGPACGRRGTGRSPANPREAVLAADLITASLIRLLAVPGQYASCCCVFLTPGRAFLARRTSKYVLVDPLLPEPDGALQTIGSSEHHHTPCRRTGRLGQSLRTC